MTTNPAERRREIRRRRQRREKQRKFRNRLAAAKDEKTREDLRKRILKINPLAQFPESA